MSATMTQLYNMKWDNHMTNMTKVLKHILLNETFCDVTLACEGTSLKAHKIILSAGSSYFQSLLSENPCKHPIVVLKDMHYLDLKVILDFMYGGQAFVAENQLHELKRISDALGVKGFDEAVLERCQPGDRPALPKSVQPSPRRRKRRRRTSALSDSIDGGASGSKKSDSDVELLHIIHKESPSSPIENTDEPSNLQDQTTENVHMQSSATSSHASESIANNGNQQPKFSSDRDIPVGVEPVELPSGNLNSGHQIGVNQVNEEDSDVEFIDADYDIVSMPRSIRKQQPKQDAAKDIVPAEEIGVKPDKLDEKILTSDHTPMLLEDQIPTEDQPAKQCPDKKLIPYEFGNESSKIEEESLTTDDTTMPFEGQIPTEDQPAKQSTDKKCLVPYEIESSETEEKNVSDNVLTSCVDRSCADIADQQLECSSDSVPIDVDQSSTENFCLKGLVEVTNKNYGKSLAIANQQPECSPDDVYDAQDELTPNINGGDELPPAKRRKKTFENGSRVESDEDSVDKENLMINDESDDEDSVEKEKSDESDDEDSVEKEKSDESDGEDSVEKENFKSGESDEDSVQNENHVSDEKEFFQEGKILDECK